MSSIPLPATTQPTAVPADVIADATIDAIRTATEHLDTPATTPLDTLANAAQAGDKLLRAQAGIVMLRTRVERTIGELVNTNQLGEHHLRRHGISKQRATIAGQLALLDQATIDTHTLNGALKQGDPSINSARTLLPRNTRPEPVSSISLPAALPAHVEIARDDTSYIADEYLDYIGEARARAIQQMPNPKHAYVYLTYEGISEDGTQGERWSLGQIANAMGTSREYVGRLYFEARVQVQNEELKAMAELVVQLRKQLEG